MYKSSTPALSTSGQPSLKNEADGGAVDVKLSDSCVKVFTTYNFAYVAGILCAQFKYDTHRKHENVKHAAPVIRIL